MGPEETELRCREEGEEAESREISQGNQEYGQDGRRYRGHDMDQHGERAQQVENVPRHAPWIVNVDWGRCSNVTEL
jgi:hypothetical protein